PKEIADALNLDAGTVRQTCRRMQADDQLRAAPGGAYSPTGHSAAGDSGDSGDNRAREPLSLLSLRHSTTPDQEKRQ
ncbi:hypothetical protein FVA95_19430, partial [Pseudonocardia sp. EV170527-09]